MSIQHTSYRLVSCVLIILLVNPALCNPGTWYNDNDIRQDSGDDDDGGGDCFGVTECEDNGECVDGFCDCDEDYTGSNCEDKRRSKLIAILLYLFVGGVGAGNFYAGYTTYGIVQAVMFGLALVPVCGWIWAVPWFLANLIWNVVFLVQIATDARDDADGHGFRD